MARTPVTAALLDFFVWGVGHGYVGRRRALFFPWIIWTLGFAVWNIIGALIWENSARCGCEFATIQASGFFAVEAVNWGAVVAFFFVPTLIIGGLLAVDVYRSETSLTGGGAPSMMNRLGPQTAAQMAPQPAPQPTQQPVTRPMTFCRSCGAANTPGDTFCANCGAPLGAPAAQAPSPAAVKICTNCGTSNPAQNSFCKRCGTRLT